MALACPFTRETRNPLLTPADMPFENNGAFNPAVADLGDEIVLLLRIERREGMSELRVARSPNGVDNWEIADLPLLAPDHPEYPFEEWGCEDARVTRLENGQWVIAYTAYGRYGPTVALATTDDRFESVERIGSVTVPPNKNAALFPVKLDGRWLMLNRPETGGRPQIWYSFSHADDLDEWTLPGLLIPSHIGPWWDSTRIGAGAPPIRTKDGWLLIYHGAKAAAGTLTYRLGLALLDLDDPRKVIARASDWVFAPLEPYEVSGAAGNVVFTCGTALRDDEVWMYYGAADTNVALARAKTDDLLEFVWRYNYLEQAGLDKGMVP
ncbi:MAG TPA: glycosidase [Armatimonadetes bacterium]|nr:glycosidase [Armatimonadota bacterium]